MNPEHSDPPAQETGTLVGMGIHISYIRKNLEELNRKMDNLSGVFVTTEDFARHEEADADHEKRIRTLEEFKDTLTGKMIGVAATSGFIVGIITLIIDHIWK